MKKEGNRRVKQESNAKLFLCILSHAKLTDLSSAESMGELLSYLSVYDFVIP